MIDTKLCVRCKYHGYIGARDEKNPETNIMCDYAELAHDGTCLRKVKGNIIDRRGDKFDECLLFVEGEKIERREPEKIHKTVRTIDKSKDRC